VDLLIWIAGGGKWEEERGGEGEGALHVLGVFVVLFTVGWFAESISDRLRGRRYPGCRGGGEEEGGRGGGRGR